MNLHTYIQTHTYVCTDLHTGIVTPQKAERDKLPRFSILQHPEPLMT